MKKLFVFALATLMLFATACDNTENGNTPLTTKDSQGGEELPVFNEPADITWLLSERTLTLSDGTVVSYSRREYDENGNIINYFSDDNGHTYSNVSEYNDLGYLEKEYVYSDGEETLAMEFFYDEKGNVIKILERSGGQTLGYHKTYDDENRMIQQIFTYVTSPTDYETLSSSVYSYNDDGRMIEQIDYDADGNITMHFYEVYDEQGRMIHRYTDHDQSTQSGFDYYYSTDENGNVTMSTKLRDHAAVIYDEVYDANGKEIKSVNYNDIGEITSIRETTYNENGDETSLYCDYNYDGIYEWTRDTEYDEYGSVKFVRVVSLGEQKNVTETTYNGNQMIEKTIIDDELYSTLTAGLLDGQGYYTSYLYVDAQNTIEKEYTFDDNYNLICVETYTNGELTNTETQSWVACENYHPYESEY